MQPATILYVGEKSFGEAFRAEAESLNWHVYLPGDLREALGVYVALFPDVVVLDSAADSKFAEAVHFHLQSVDAGPVIVLMGSDEPEWMKWGDYAVPRAAGLDAVVNAVAVFAEVNLQPS
jgi:hypothetical protein